MERITQCLTLEELKDKLLARLKKAKKAKKERKSIQNWIALVDELIAEEASGAGAGPEEGPQQLESLNPDSASG